MKSAFYRLLLFLSPFIFISLFILLIDPYNLFNVSHIIKDEVKIKCINRTRAIAPRGNILWKIIEFKRNPSPNIILGDSRLVDISNSKVEKEIGGKVSNLAVPAGNYKTLADLFWMAANTIKLQNVIIETGFSTYNSLRNFDLYKPAMKTVQEPLTYFFGWTYLKDSFIVLYHSNEKVIKSYKDVEDNWIIAYNSMIRNFPRYEYPEETYKELVEISEYCKKERINLIFVIAPDYNEVHNLVKRYSLEDEYYRFKSDIGTLGTLIDLDNGQPFSFNKDNYYDYYHIKPAIADTLVSMIFHSTLIKGKFVNK